MVSTPAQITFFCVGLCNQRNFRKRLNLNILYLRLDFKIQISKRLNVGLAI